MVRNAESCAAAMAVCPFDLIVKVLHPIVKTEPYPKNQAAIKMLTKLIEYHSNEITDKHLEVIMPGLIQVIIYLVNDMNLYVSYIILFTVRRTTTRKAQSESALCSVWLRSILP